MPGDFDESELTRGERFGNSATSAGAFVSDPPEDGMPDWVRAWVESAREAIASDPNEDPRFLDKLAAIDWLATAYEALTHEFADACRDLRVMEANVRDSRATADRLTREHDQAVQERDALRRIGGQFANVAYNLTQGRHLDDRALMILDEIRREWDASIRARSTASHTPE